MNVITPDFLSALTSATPERYDAALRVLRGDSDTPAPQSLLTGRAVCDRLGVSLSTLYRHQVPCLKLGGTTRFRLADVEAALARPSTLGRTGRKGPRSPVNRNTTPALPVEVNHGRHE